LPAPSNFSASKVAQVAFFAIFRCTKTKRLAQEQSAAQVITKRTAQVITKQTAQVITKRGSSCQLEVLS